MNYHMALPLIVACIDYSPKVTTMKLTIADDTEVIAEFFSVNPRFVQSLLVALVSNFKCDVISQKWEKLYRGRRSRGRAHSICRGQKLLLGDLPISVVTPPTAGEIHACTRNNKCKAK